MKKILILSAVIGTLFSAQYAVANDIELKRSCLKSNPIMEGITDGELIRIFTAVCDKDNKDKKNGYLAQAAQRFQEIGQNWKALQLVNALQSANIQGNTLTDVKFLAASAIAESALDDIRNREGRYLTSDGTYPAGKKLVDKINAAKPASVLVGQSVNSASNSVRESQRTTRTPARQRHSTRTTSSRSTTSAPKPTTAPKPTAPAKTSNSPFSGF